MRILLAAFLTIWGGAAAALCPDPTLDGPRFAAAGADLIVPDLWELVAGGDQVAPCGTWVVEGRATNGISGLLPQDPTAVFDLTGMGPHILIVRAIAPCDPTLVVHSADGLWYFGEVKNGTPEVTLWGAPNGELRVWMGTQQDEGCEGGIQLETYDR